MIKIGRFYEKTKTHQGREEYCEGPYCEPTRDTFSKTDSLLFIKNSGPSILDGIFVPLEFELEDRMPLVTRIYSKAGYSDHRLGTVRLLNKGLNIGIADVKSVGCLINGMVVEIGSNTILTQESNPSFTGNSVDILLAGHPILSAKIKKKDECMEFSPTDEKIVIVRGDGREILDIDKLAERGIVYLAFYHEGSQAIKIPFARWLKEKVKVNYGQNH